MEEKKLTDEEIVKVLECCSLNCNCKECPFDNEDDGCLRANYNMEKVVLNLIHRLQGENERLTEENEILKGNPPILVGRSLGKTIRAKLLAFDRMKEQNAELQKQVDELKSENTELYKERTTLIAGSILKQQDIAKDTAKEIHALAVQHWHGYESDMENFMLALKERYGVEVEW